MEEKDNDKSLETLMNDDQLREWFYSRDPERKKSNPFLTEDAEKQYTGKSSTLTKVEKVEDEKSWGISYSEHDAHLKKTSKTYFWLGVITGLIIAIVIASVKLTL